MFKAKLLIPACVGAFLTCGLAPTVASAATAGWMTNGTLLSGTGLVSTTAKVDEPWSISAAGVTTTCSGNNVNIVDGTIKSPSSGSAASLEFTSCLVSNLVNCSLGKTSIKTIPVLAEATLDGASADKITFSPGTKTTFTTIEYLGASCPLEGIQPVTGKAVVLAPNGQTETAAQLVKASGESTLKIGSSAASLLGSALITLEDNQPWSFL
jgi:hypothetical protein